MAEQTQEGSNMQMQHLRQQQQQLHQHNMALHSFWQKQMKEITSINPKKHDFKTAALPLARIKKIMKIDEDVKMISAEAPVLFAKACEMFILELSMRSWVHTEENKRRTLQRSDIATAITKTDVFDFLIDIVPRDEVKSGKKAGLMDPQMIYQQQLQQQQAAMFHQYMQSQAAAAAAAAGNPAMAWSQQMQHPQASIEGRGTVDV